MSEESIIGKFFGVLGFKVDHRGVEEFQNSLTGLKHAVEGIFAIAIIERAVEFVEKSIGAAAAVNDLAEVTEMSATRIDALGRVAAENSASLESMSSAIMSVYRATGQAAMGIGRNVKLFRTLGIDPKQIHGVDDAMTKLADKFQKMDMSKVIGTASRLGIDPMIAKAMKEMGGEGWRKAVQEAMGKGLLTDADYEQADKTEKTFKRFHILTSQISALLANQLAPWIRKAVDSVEKFLTENKVKIIEKIKGAMHFLSQILGVVWGWGERLFSSLTHLYQAMEKSRTAGEALRLVLVTIAFVKAGEIFDKVATAVNNMWTAFTAAPKALSIIGLILVGIGLLVEDFMAWKAGEESVFKDLNEKWPNAIKVISVAMEGLLAVWLDIVAAARVLGIIAKEDAAPKTSIAWYKKMQANPPLPPSADYADYMKMKAMIESGQHPAQQLFGNMASAAGPVLTMADVIRNGEATNKAKAADITGILADIEAKRPGALNPASIAGILADVDARRSLNQSVGGITYITGTKVEVKADTPERAKASGASVRDALSSQQIRDYQPRGI
jgi:hypothetical protein